jgi:hypothetical protein
MAMPAFPSLMGCKQGRFDYRWLQSGNCAVFAKEAAMIDTFRAFLYGVLILVSALIPPVVSVIQQLKS